VALLGICLVLETRSWWTHETMSRRLDSLAPPEAMADATENHGGFAAVTRREASLSGLIGEIEIARIGLSAVVLEGDTESSLSAGVGHVTGTAFPGEAGNVALAAHRDTYFRPLQHVEPGDSVWIRTPDGRFGYEVDSVLIVAPDRTDVLRDSGRSELTLVTCYPFHWIGPAPKRYVVHARALESGTGPSSNPDSTAGPELRTPFLEERPTGYAVR
jgi:sortase A